MRNLKKLGLALLFSANLLSGCGNSAPVGATQAATDDPIEACQAMFEREAACTDSFIPMLVDLRIRHDVPAGIAESAREPNGRAELIAIAKQEWSQDSLPAARARTCARVAPGQPQSQVAAVRTCLAKSSCDQVVACLSPFHEARIAASR